MVFKLFHQKGLANSKNKKSKIKEIKGKFDHAELRLYPGFHELFLRLYIVLVVKKKPFGGIAIFYGALLEYGEILVILDFLKLPKTA